MRLKRIALENVCQFASLDHAFHAGLTGIIGPNGSGKSNLTKAIFFALTGQFRNAGVKADNVAQAGEPQRAHVRLWLEHDGVDLDITRGLAGARTQLLVGDDPEPVRGDVAATERIMDVLGVDARLLGEYVFILQLHMADFIDATPADRSRVFQRLFGTDQAEAVHAFITKVVDKGLPAPAPAADLPAVRARLEANGDRMAALLDRLDSLDDVLEHDSWGGEPAALVVVADAAWCDENAREIGRLTQQMDRLQEEYRTNVAAASDLRRDLSAVEVNLETAEPAARAAVAALDDWTKWEYYNAWTRRLADRRARLAAYHADVPVAVPEFTDRDRQRRRDLDGQAARLERQLLLLDAGTVECPTCGQATAAVGDCESLRRDLAVVLADFDALEAVNTAWSRYSTLLAAYRAAQAGQAAAMVDLEAEEQSLAEVPRPAEPTVGRDELRRAVAAEHDLRRRLPALRAAHAAAAREADRFQGAWDGLHERHRELVAAGKARHVTPEALAAAREGLASLAAARAERDRLAGEAAELARTLDADEALVANMEARAVADAATARLREGAKHVAAVLHRGAAPRLVAEDHLARMVDGVAENLEAFGADFGVRLGPDLSFLAAFADGRVQPAARLSEGQKALLALAFWVEVNSLFARQVGFLSLDEPTASLDQHSIGALEVALGRLRDLSRSVGLQCLLVTHEQSLAGLFDDVIQL